MLAPVVLFQHRGVAKSRELPDLCRPSVGAMLDSGVSLLLGAIRGAAR